MYRGSMRVIVNNEEIELFTIGHLSKQLKKSVETIRAWERQKVLPRPMYKNKSIRLYHPKEIEVMKKVLKKLGKYAKKEDVQREMWAALKEVRQEILHGHKDNPDGS